MSIVSETSLSDLQCFSSPKMVTYIGNERWTDHHNDKVLEAIVRIEGKMEWPSDTYP